MFKELNVEIADMIIIDYINEMDEQIPSKTIGNKLSALRDAGLAYVIEGSEYFYGIWEIKLRFAMHYIQKLNPELKEYVRKNEKYEYGADDRRTADMIPEIVNICTCLLECGTYYAEIKDKEYMMLKIENKSDEDTEMFKYTIAFIGKDWRKTKNKFFKKYDAIASLKEKDKFGWIRYTNGKSMSKAMFKPFDKLIFKNKNEIVEYIDNWVEHIPTYYNEYNMIPKLSILAYGRPGTGKSTLAQAIAKHLDINTIHSLSDEYFENESKGRNNFSEAIFNIEDIDCICGKRSDKDVKDEADITNDQRISKMLSFLDNPPTMDFKAKDGVRYPVSIIVASTNYIDKLDDAIKRKGRFDTHIEMEYHDETLAREFADLFKLKLEDVIETKIEKDFEISPADLQSKCMEKIDKRFKSTV